MSGQSFRPDTSQVRAMVQPRRPAAVGRIETAQDPRRALRGLLRYLAPFRGGLALVLLSVITYSLLGLAGPYLLGRAIDGFIATKEAAGLGRMALLMLLVYLLYNLFQALAAGLMANISQRALKRIRGDLFAHLQQLPVAFFDRRTEGELMSRLTNDVDAINQAVSQNVTALFASVLSLGGILIAMFAIDWRLALATLVVVPIMFWFTQFVARYTRHGFRRLQRELGEANGFLEEALSGQKVITAFGRTASVMDVFSTRNQAVFSAGVAANSYALLLMPVTGVLGNFFIIVLAGLGGWLALGGLVTVGTIATFINYGQNFVQPLRQLANMYNAIQGALAGAERVLEILDSPPEVDVPSDDRPAPPVVGDVSFEHVTFGYRAGTPVIRDMSLHARAGETLALVGPTGAGKTTVINLLTRFYEIDEGAILIDGRDVRTIPKADLRRQMGLVLQDTYLFSGSVLENIRYGRLDATDEEVKAAARLAEAEPFIRQMPQGYDTLLTERASNLSQGQRQLLAIARAILADPGILILDEATSSVDTRTEARIQRALQHLMRGRTSFVIAHRLSTIRDADQVVVIDDGAIVERGTHRELLARRGFYYRLYLSQFKGQEI